MASSPSTKTDCKSCGGSLRKQLVLGRQPVTNRFVHSQSEKESRFDLSIGACDRCALMQLIDSPPAEEIKPRVSWITYNEPEAHLDCMVDTLRVLPGITPTSNILGVSFKDESTIRRFSDHGFTKTKVLDPKAGIETLQSRITKSWAEKMTASDGQFDIVIARHILEHAFDLSSFLEGLKALMKPNGYLVLEIPDCENELKNLDYNSIWEEHIFYFTTPTFRNALARAGFEVTAFTSYPYALENSLVAVAKKTDRPITSTESIDSVRRLNSDFISSFERKKAAVRESLADHRRKHGAVAMLGAGHHTAMFLNLFELKDTIDSVMDDNPNKAGLFMPGSQLPILPSAALLDRSISLCLMGVSPASEPKIIKNNQRFLEKGGRLASIFSESDHGYKFDAIKTH